MQKLVVMVLGGGKGSRLLPLTQSRAKPDVPFAGKYRLVDLPISNCFHAGFKNIYVLTQFNSTSLHSHVQNTYQFPTFERGFVEILAAEQTYDNAEWYKGTADAIRQSLHHVQGLHAPGHYLILSGDQLYRLDLLDFYHKHVKTKAQVSVAVTPVSRPGASQLGIAKIDAQTLRITAFREKPGLSADIEDFAAPNCRQIAEQKRRQGQHFLASMGIYLFNSMALAKALDNEHCDFGKDVLPDIIARLRVHAYVFNGYWEDIGTIETFYEANLKLTHMEPPFNFYDEERPIYTGLTHLPASKVNSCTMHQSLTSEGCIITNATIRNSIIGQRMIVEDGVCLDGVIAMGNDRYESLRELERNSKKGKPPLGIDRGSVVRKTILDQNVRIGKGCRIGTDPIDRPDGHYRAYSVAKGIIVIKQGAIIPDGTVI